MNTHNTHTRIGLSRARAVRTMWTCVILVGALTTSSARSQMLGPAAAASAFHAQHAQRAEPPHTVVPAQPELSQPDAPAPVVSEPDQIEPNSAQPENAQPTNNEPKAEQPKLTLPDNYPDLDAIYERLSKTAEDHPDICRFVDLTERLGMPATHEGRHIFAMKISDNPSISENEPAVLIVSNHHARELPAIVTALEAIDTFTDHYSSDIAITALVDQHEIWIAPLWNPDGYNYVCTTDRMWRKNRRDNADGTFGVDLNRNYPFGWDEPCAGSADTTSETYKGPSAASEPETQTMIAFASAERFAKVADLHAYAGEIRFGYGCWTHPFHDFYQHEVIRLSESSGMEGRHRRSCCLAGNIHFHMSNTGSFAALWEIGRSFNPPHPEAMSNAYNVIPGILMMLHRPMSVSGRVYDAVTLKPINATITMPNAGFGHDEASRSGGQYGRYHMVLAPGEHVLDFVADGYQPASIAVSVTQTSEQIYDMALLPSTQSAGQQE